MKERSTGNTVAVIDGGGRGSTLLRKYAESNHVKRLIGFPSNDLAGLNIDKEVLIFKEIDGRKLKTTDIADMLEVCKKYDVALVDVAQDNAIFEAAVNRLRKEGFLTVGPTKEAGQIEWSKVWAREFGKKYGLPQPFFNVCHSQQEGFDFIKSQPDQPWFVKADGLAEGKGGLSAKNNEEALKRIKEMERFKDVGKTFLIEEWLKNDDGTPGEEFSTFAYFYNNGKDYEIVGSAQDNKTANDFDEGENTGGMGCSSPPYLITPELMEDIRVNIFDKVVDGLLQESVPYNGILYLGGMVVKRNGRLEPYVIEFNARWGDPEAQVIVPAIQNDFFELNMTVAQNGGSKLNIKTDNSYRIATAGVSKGYPEDYSQVKGKQIFGLRDVGETTNSTLYGAGVKVANGKDIADGGRLFYVTSEGANVIDAKSKNLAEMARLFIEGNNLHYRKDTGWRDVARYYTKLKK